MFDPAAGIGNEDLEEWLRFNVLAAGTAGAPLAPFPPAPLMHRTSGLTRAQDFAAHGQLITSALASLLPRPLRSYPTVVDFGVGAGRVARVFKGHAGTYFGLDIDRDLIDWVTRDLDYVAAIRLVPNRRIPLGDGLADLVLSVSVFSHMDAGSCAFYLKELVRLAAPGGVILLTTHGARALERARAETPIREMLSLTPPQADAARAALEDAGFAFVEQTTHLSDATYRYGMTFLAEAFVRRVCADLPVADISSYSGHVADFQDVVRIVRLG